MPASAHQPGLPLVVQVAFAGSRRLLDTSAHPGVDRARFEAAVEAHLTDRLRQLPAELGLSAQAHFLCAHSQLAIGADTLFTRACRTLEIPQRIFLPQPSDLFLTATNRHGVPDFDAAERRVASALFASSHIIEVRVVSGADDRSNRFDDVSLELARVCDVAVCLIRANAGAKAGGTRSLIAQAQRRGRAVLVIEVDVDSGGQPTFRETWPRGKDLQLPRMPSGLPAITWPAAAPRPAQTDVTDYCRALKTASSAAAKSRQGRFRAGALVIIGAHVLATLLAVSALTLHSGGEGGDHRFHAALVAVLAVEVVLLVVGFGMHELLHRARTTLEWAKSRLTAEIARSVLALVPLHVYLEHLFTLPFDLDFRPMLRTINVLYLRSTRGAGVPWQQCRAAYLAARLNEQLAYYEKHSSLAGRQLEIAHQAFRLASGLAVVVTGYKLAIATGAIGGSTSIAGVLAVVLPVLAVAFLSLAAAFDLEARKHVYRDMRTFLERQTDLLTAAGSEREYVKLVLETESRLLGEPANWFARRSFTGVA